MPVIDAALPIEEGGNRITLGPHKILDQWLSIRKSGWGRVDAVVAVPGKPNEVYVFFGGHYFRTSFNEHLRDIVVHPVSPIKSAWNGLAAVGFNTIDAGLCDQTNEDFMYFFSGTKSVKYSWSKDEAISSPHEISEYWSILGKAGFDRVDAIYAARNMNNTYYVFRGHQYLALDWNGYRNESLKYGPNILAEAWSDTFKEWP
ncbi:hypothetical protein PENFLA_c020G07909 [Penicillium flavigenum]|uniref:Hemopexin n=1 Tax=Penicillium flavigenum TaxID=254877 RepID=A0A1V6SXV3_9EURO|nr:hypothetical protein PENFLA_c020G07909 [Penicillium flavigenum]